LLVFVDGLYCHPVGNKRANGEDNERCSLECCCTQQGVVVVYQQSHYNIEGYVEEDVDLAYQHLFHAVLKEEYGNNAHYDNQGSQDGNDVVLR
jgi:hypothetical protein